jgi:hypothetical protein
MATMPNFSGSHMQVSALGSYPAVFKVVVFHRRMGDDEVQAFVEPAGGRKTA